MFFVGLFSSQIAFILIYLSIFLFFSFSILSHDFDSEIISFNNSCEKTVIFDASEKNFQNSKVHTIFELLHEKPDIEEQTKNTYFHKANETFNKFLASSNLIYHFETESFINSRPPPTFS